MKTSDFGAALVTAHSFATCVAVVFLICIFLSGSSPIVAQETPKRILILHSYNYNLPSMTLAADGARKRLPERSPHKIELDVVYLDLERYSEPEQEQVMARFLRDRYAHRPPHVIMTSGPDGLPFITRHRDELAPGIPVVFLLSRRPLINLRLRRRM